MDSLTFIANIVGSLAWPVAAVALVMLFRGEIVKAAPFLKKLKAGPVEAEFDLEVKQLKESADLKDRIAPDRAADIASKKFLFQLAELHPRSAILESWVRLEAAARAALSQDTSKASKTGYVPAAMLSQTLVQSGKIDQSQVTLYHELRRLRNDVAHLVGPEPTKESVRSYIELASALQSHLERETK
ncbi:MAG: hypothetical protein AB1393_05125 [Candidatus Edwardsbacteria bacterium]